MAEPMHITSIQTSVDFPPNVMQVLTEVRPIEYNDKGNWAYALVELTPAYASQLLAQIETTRNLIGAWRVSYFQQGVRFLPYSEDIEKLFTAAQANDGYTECLVLRGNQRITTTAQNSNSDSWKMDCYQLHTYQDGVRYEASYKYDAGGVETELIPEAVLRDIAREQRL